MLHNEEQLGVIFTLELVRYTVGWHAHDCT